MTVEEMMPSYNKDEIVSRIKSELNVPRFNIFAHEEEGAIRFIYSGRKYRVSTGFNPFVEEVQGGILASNSAADRVKNLLFPSTTKSKVPAPHKHLLAQLVELYGHNDVLLALSENATNNGEDWWAMRIRDITTSGR
jgi:hypothetical protein